MKYNSTRNKAAAVEASTAILRGIAPDGGLYLPQEIPQVNYKKMLSLTYPQLAQAILSLFLTDYEPSFLLQAAENTYGETFGGKAGFVKEIGDGAYALELWHGPTCAFKDYALQLMPKLLVQAKKNLHNTDVTKILVATSGDTGKAALAGYKDLENIKIAVFYPNDGTSEVQKLQMATQEGNNVAVYAVQGNFDDAQTGVKRVFADTAVADALAKKGEALSSANSINWGRLAPQIVYYFYAYAQMVESGAIQAGEKLSFCVPTGNFGDILAGWYAKHMGLPVDKLVCASNENNVLTEFLQTGTYNANRTFFKTSSPSMDILISSNLERLLFCVCGDDAKVSDWMKELRENGKYTVDAATLAAIQEDFLCGFADEAAVQSEIHAVYEQYKYVCDPHTAVATCVAKQQLAEKAPYVVLSTANPYKFPCDVLRALTKEVPTDEFAAMQKLQEKTGLPVPPQLACLRDKPVRFTEIIDKSEIGAIALSL